MPDSNGETPAGPKKFDFSAYPPDSLFHERRTGFERRQPAPPRADVPAAEPGATGAAPAPRARKDRRRRIDPTTFEKQYTDDEIEFMTAVQHFKVQSGKPFPSHGDVLRVAASLGYRRVYWDEEDADVSGESDASIHEIVPV